MKPKSAETVLITIFVIEADGGALVKQNRTIVVHGYRAGTYELNRKRRRALQMFFLCPRPPQDTYAGAQRANAHCEYSISCTQKHASCYVRLCTERLCVIALRYIPTLRDPTRRTPTSTVTAQSVLDVITVARTAKEEHRHSDDRDTAYNTDRYRRKGTENT